MVCVCRAAIAPANLAYIPQSQLLPLNQSCSIAPADGYFSGTPAAQFTAPSLPSGLTIDVNTGVISGTPEVGCGWRNYTVTSSNGVYSLSTRIALRIPGEVFALFGVHHDGIAVDIKL